jgi:hypothetical protein
VKRLATFLRAAHAAENKFSDEYGIFKYINVFTNRA